MPTIDPLVRGVIVAAPNLVGRAGDWCKLDVAVVAEGRRRLPRPSGGREVGLRGVEWAEGRVHPLVMCRAPLRTGVGFSGVEVLMCNVPKADVACCGVHSWGMSATNGEHGEAD
jgi:hypothetical protein